MAGGQGIRFWPWSVKKKPKQFLPLKNGKTMLQETYERYKSWVSIQKIYVVTTEGYYTLVKEQLPDLPQEQILLEPERRDTGPCVALTALNFLDKDDDEVLVMSPSDHHISNPEELMKSLLLAEKVAKKENSIVTLGISPTRPETGYGYIKVINNIPQDNQALKVEEFIEKPSLSDAEKLLNNDHIFWNSGIFVWKPSTIAYYMEKFQSHLWNTLKDGKDQLKKTYSTLPKISVDYAILEKANTIYTIPTNFEWDDLGSWTAMERLNEKDNNKNILIGNVNAISSNNCIVISHLNDKTLALGVTDLIIVLTEDGLLVCHKSLEQEIKNILNYLNDLNVK